MRCANVRAAVDDTLQRILSNGKAAGTFTSNVEQVKRYIAMGCQFVAVGADTGAIDARNAGRVRRRHEREWHRSWHSVLIVDLHLEVTRARNGIRKIAAGAPISLRAAQVAV